MPNLTNSPATKQHLSQSGVWLNTWKLIRVYSVSAAGLSAKPSLQEGVTSLGREKDNRTLLVPVQCANWDRKQTPPPSPRPHKNKKITRELFSHSLCPHPMYRYFYLAQQQIKFYMLKFTDIEVFCPLKVGLSSLRKYKIFIQKNSLK